MIIYLFINLLIGNWCQNFSEITIDFWIINESKTKLKVLKKTLDKSIKLTREKKLTKTGHFKVNQTNKIQNRAQSVQNSTQLSQFNEQLKNDSYFNKKNQSNKSNQFNQQNQQNRQNNLNNQLNIYLKDNNYLLIEQNKIILNTNLNSIDQMTKSNEFILNSTQQMEELNGIISDETMHLLDLFSDTFFSNKFIDNKDKIESDNVYNLNNDDLDLDNQLNDVNNFDYNSNQILTSNYSTANDLTQQKDTIENLSPISFHNSPQQNSTINQISNQNSFKNYQANFGLTATNQSTTAESDQNGKIQANQMTNLNKQNRTKKVKNFNNQQSKKKTPKIKFHEYKGPQNSIQKYSKDQLMETNLDKFKEQQNNLQKQLLNQISINTAKLKGSQQIPINNLQQIKETVPLKVNVPFNTSGLNQQDNLNSFPNAKTIQIGNGEIKSNSPKSSQTNDENLIKNNKFIPTQENLFRYSPTNENQYSVESKDQFNLDLGSSQLTPPYQQSKNLNNFNSNNNKQIYETSLMALNESNIEKLEELKVQDLKMYLKKYNLPVTGPKKVQQQRLKNFVLKNKPIGQNQTNNLNNFQSNQLTPPNTPMELDGHLIGDQYSDLDDTSKYTDNNNKANPILNSSNHLFNGKIYVNNSHFSAQIPLNSIPYAIHQNQIQFQNSQNTTTNTANSFTLPIASIQPQQIHFLNNPIITNTANQQQINNQLSQQLTNTSLTVHHPQLTTIPQNTLSNTTIVATTPILLYSRNSITNSTSIDSFNQPQQQQQINANDLMNDSNKSQPINSVKLSIRKNILLKQKKQEQKQLQMNQKQSNKQSKNINNDKIMDKQQELYSNNTNKMNEVYQTNYFTPNDQEMKIENKIEEKNDFELLMEIKEVADFIKETDKDNKENDDLNKIEKFDYLNKVKEDYSNKTIFKTSHTRQLDQLDRIDQINKEDELNQLKQLETKNNLEFNDMDSILNCEISDLEISNLNTEDDFTDFWLNNQDNLIDSNITNNDFINETAKQSSKIEHDEYNCKNNENANFLPNNLMESSPTYKGENSKNDDFQNYVFCNNSKQSNFFETTNCNFMDPVLNNFYSDQNSPIQYLDENDLNFKIAKPESYTNSEFNISFDKNNFTAY